MNDPLQIGSAPTESACPTSVGMPVWVQMAIAGIFLLLFIAFLDLGRAILLPVVSAVIIGTVLNPLAKYVERYGVPHVVFAAAVVAILLAAAYLGFLVLSDPIVEVVKDAPRIGTAIQNRLQELYDNFAVVRYLHGLVAEDGARLTIDFAGFVKPAVAFLTPALGQLAVFFATLFLFLLDQDKLRHKLVLVFPTHEARLRALHVLKDVNDNLVRYIGTVAVINLGVGVITTIGLYLLGFPNPLFWGTAAFICNFVPYIGPTFITIALLVVGLITFPSISYALLVPGLFVILMTLEGHVITPNVIGYSFRTGALLAFLSLAFWTWLWGPIGAFLSLPLLIIGAVVLSHLVPAKTVDLPA